MTTYRELLEQAAKAAGVKYDPERSKPHPVSKTCRGLWLTYDREPDEFDRRRWNPLRDDGDALRLAVKLGMNIKIDEEEKCTRIFNEFDAEILRHMHFDNDEYSATRRAIVRAAAEIGKTML